MRRGLLVRGARGALTHRLRAAAAMSAAPPPAEPPPPRPPLPKVLVITGPTAVGKTAAALALARRLGGEVVSADSVQVYRGLDVGSDKPPAAARRGVPHHLLDVLDPREEFSAGAFYERAHAALADVVSRGRTPVVAGGTGLYLRWLMRGRPATRPSTPASAAAAAAHLAAARARAEAAAGAPLGAAARWAAGVAAVAALGDAASAAALEGEPNNEYRLLRVLDVLLQARGEGAAGRVEEEGAPGEARAARAAGAAPPATRAALAAAAAPPPAAYDFRAFFLHRPRAELYRRIDARAEEMIAGGLLAEAAGLLRAGAAPGSSCAARAVGYRQAMEFLAACAAGRDAPTEAALWRLARGVAAASHQLVKRQTTWFRRDPDFVWVDARGGEAAVVAAVLAAWDAPPRGAAGGGGAAGGAAAGGGAAADEGALSAAEVAELKRYVPAPTLLAPGSAAAAATAAEAAALVAALRAEGIGG